MTSPTMYYNRNIVIGGFSAIFLRLVFATWLLTERKVHANHLSCVCSLAECENVSELDCPNGAGTVWDSCRCCRICARVENEPCGGPYGFSGSCAEGLECVVTDLFRKNAVGVCTRILNKEMSCKNPLVISGCNIVDSTCRCEHAESCVEESPFNFKTRLECEMNLDAMLAQKDESADDEGSLNFYPNIEYRIASATKFQTLLL